MNEYVSDRATVVHTLDLFRTPGKPFEIAFIQQKPGEKDTRVFSAIFDDPQTAVVAIQAANVPFVKGVYMLLNPMRETYSNDSDKWAIFRNRKRTEAGDIAARRWVFLDFDPVRDSWTNATDAEKSKAWDAMQTTISTLSELGYPQPYVTADSGNGYHAVYALEMPNDNESGALVKSWMEAICAKFSTPAVKMDTANSDAPRLCKLYGTQTRKGEDTPDRPARASAILTEGNDRNNHLLTPGDLRAAIDYCGSAIKPVVAKATDTRSKRDKQADALRRMSEVEDVIAQMEQKGIRFAADRDKWLGPSCALAQMGEAGIDLFNRFNALWEHADPAADEKKMLRDFAPKGRNSIDCFFKFAREYGIRPRASSDKFPLDGLGEWARWIAEDVIATYQSDASFTIGAMFAATATIAAKKFICKRGIYPDGVVVKHTNYPQLWIGLLADPGGGKTSPLRDFFAPIEAMDQASFDRWRADADAWDASDAKNKGARPVNAKHFTSDFTPEVLDGLLYRQQAVALKANELNGLFQCLERYTTNSAAMSHLLDAFDNEGYPIDREGKDPRRVSSPILSMAGTIQPETVARFLNKIPNNGFTPRWLWLYPERLSFPEENDRTRDPQTVEDWARFVTSISRAPDFREMHPTPDAAAIRRDYYNELQARKASANAVEMAIYAKLQINVWRWAMVAQILAGVPDSGLITADTMQYSVDCMRYFERTALRVAKLTQAGKKMTDEAAIQHLAAAHPELKKQLLANALGVTVQHISQVVKRGKAKTTADEE